MFVYMWWNIFFLPQPPRRTCDKWLNNDVSINGVELFEINSFIIEVMYSRLLLRACLCVYVCFEGNASHGNVIFHLRVSRHVCQKDRRVYVKKWKIQCVAIVAVGLDLSGEKSRRDTPTNYRTDRRVSS